MAPYVYSLGSTPDDGIMGFLETPKYSTGYATLFGTLGFTTEAHMLKPSVTASSRHTRFSTCWRSGSMGMLTFFWIFGMLSGNALLQPVHCRCVGSSQPEGQP